MPGEFVRGFPSLLEAFVRGFGQVARRVPAGRKTARVGRAVQDRAGRGTGWGPYCGSVQDSTMRDYGPALKDLRRALGGVHARSLTDEHFEAYKRAKLAGIDVGAGSSGIIRSCSRSRSTDRTSPRASSNPMSP